MNELYGGGVIPPELRNKAQKAIDKYDKVRQQALDNIKQFKNEPNRIQLIKNKIKELDLNKKKILAILATTGLITVGVITTLSILVPALLAGIVALSSVAGIGVVGVGVIITEYRSKNISKKYKTDAVSDNQKTLWKSDLEKWKKVCRTEINELKKEINKCLTTVEKFVESKKDDLTDYKYAKTQINIFKRSFKDIKNDYSKCNYIDWWKKYKKCAKDYIDELIKLRNNISNYNRAINKYGLNVELSEPSIVRIEQRYMK